MQKSTLFHCRFYKCVSTSSPGWKKGKKKKKKKRIDTRVTIPRDRLSLSLSLSPISAQGDGVSHSLLSSFGSCRSCNSSRSSSSQLSAQKVFSKAVNKWWAQSGRSYSSLALTSQPSEYQSIGVVTTQLNPLTQTTVVPFFLYTHLLECMSQFRFSTPCCSLDP